MNTSSSDACGNCGEPGLGPDVLACLVRTYERRLLVFAQRLLGGDADAAADAVQETFLALWRRSSDAAFKTPERMDQYLLRAVHNRCTDMRRRRDSSNAELTADDADAAGAPLVAGPESAARERALADAVRDAVDRLPEAQRSVFVLSHYEGLRYKEIAEVLDCPMGTVASRKSQAVAALRVALKDWADEGDQRKGESQ